MEMHTYVANSMKEMQDFVNSRGIQKDQIISINQNNDSTYVLFYYESK